MSDDYREEFLDLIQSRRYIEALDLLGEKENGVSDNCQFFEDRAMALGLLKRYEEAIADCEKAIHIDPHRKLPWFRKSVSLYHLRRFRDSLQAFDECLTRWPHFTRAIELKISALILLGKYHEATTLYESSDLPTLRDYITYNHLGLAYLEIGNYQKAKNCLGWAKIYKFSSHVIHYNFCRLYYRQGHLMKTVLYGVLYILTWIINQISNSWLYLFGKSENLEPLVEEKLYFDGPGRLFSVNAQQREVTAILKLLRSPNFWALCNDTFGIVAANIPFEAVEQNNIKGDIDVIVSMPRTFPPTADTPYVYRGFEVKVTAVDYKGKIISPKRNARHLNKIKNQLDKLRKFGCEQTFLLEIIILQRGFSELHSFPPEELVEDMKTKAELLKNTGHGYVVMADEPTSETSDEGGGKWYQPLNILRTSETARGSGMNILADAINEFMKTEKKEPNRTFQQIPVVTYCKKCKRLTFFSPIDFYHFTCLHCGQSLP